MSNRGWILQRWLQWRLRVWRQRHRVAAIRWAAFIDSPWCGGLGTEGSLKKRLHTCRYKVAVLGALVESDLPKAERLLKTGCSCEGGNGLAS